jgi:hypothetical protein
MDSGHLVSGAGDRVCREGKHAEEEAVLKRCDSRNVLRIE